MATRRRSSTSAAKTSGGLSVAAFGGLNKKNYEKKATTYGQSIRFKEGERVTVQFAGEPDDTDSFQEFFQHSWKDGARWYFVPCAGDECPLCEEEDADKAKTSYRFIAKVYSFDEKKVTIMEGPKDLAGRLMYQFDRTGSKFTRKVWDVMPLATKPRSYQVDFNDQVSALRNVEDAKVNLSKYLQDSLKAFYGEDGLVKGNSSLDDDDDDAVDDDAPVRRKKSSGSSSTRSTRNRRTRR